MSMDEEDILSLGWKRIGNHHRWRYGESAAMWHNTNGTYTIAIGQAYMDFIIRNKSELITLMRQIMITPYKNQIKELSSTT